jgi:hypothetical protein
MDNWTLFLAALIVVGAVVYVWIDWKKKGSP